MNEENSKTTKENTELSVSMDPKSRFYSRFQVSFATFFLTPIVGTMLMARNFKKLGMKDEALQSIINGVLITVGQIILATLIPASFTALLPAAGLLLVQHYYKNKQKKYFDIHVKQGGRKGSYILDAVVAVIGIFLTAFLITYSLFGPDKMKKEMSYVFRDIVAFKDDMLDGNTALDNILYVVKKENLTVDEGLGMAIERGDIEAIDYFLDQGADINGIFNDHFTSLTLCLIYHKSDKVQELIPYFIEKGADIEAKVNKGDTPLLYAIFTLGSNYNSDSFKQTLDLIRLLLKHGANVNTSGSNGDTPLMRVSASRLEEQNKITMVKELIEQGADVNAVNEDGMSALMFAAYNETGDVLKILLEAGAKVNTKDKHGETAFKKANKNWNYTAAEILKKHGGK